MKLDHLTLQTAYFSFIRPILEYEDVVWDMTKKNDQTLEILEEVNKNAARLVCGATARCKVNNLYEENKWEFLKDRRRKHGLTIMYKMVYNLAPSYLLNLLPDKVESHTHHNLRNKQKLDLPSTRLDVHKYSSLPSAVQEWNDLDLKIKESKSVNAFKQALSKTKDNPPHSTSRVTGA